MYLSPSFSSRVMGPLHMYPPAEDNYGTDACSILCLHSQPGVLVIATAEGKLYHCVVLSNNKEQVIQESGCSVITFVFGSCFMLIQIQDFHCKLQLTPLERFMAFQGTYMYRILEEALRECGPPG